MKALPCLFCLFAFAASVLLGQSKSAPQPSGPAPQSAKFDAVYSGTWVTTKNKQLDGTATCEVTRLSADRWKGHFSGVWQHAPFDYMVEFGPDRQKGNLELAKKPRDRRVSFSPDLATIPVAGTATIDDAHYQWTGVLTRNAFNIRFTGSRYEGQLELKCVREPKK